MPNLHASVLGDIRALARASQTVRRRIQRRRRLEVDVRELVLELPKGRADLVGVGFRSEINVERAVPPTLDHRASAPSDVKPYRCPTRRPRAANSFSTRSRSAVARTLGRSQIRHDPARQSVVRAMRAVAFGRCKKLIQTPVGVVQRHRERLLRRRRDGWRTGTRATPRRDSCAVARGPATPRATSSIAG